MVLHLERKWLDQKEFPGVAGSFSVVLARQKTEQMAPSGGVVTLLNVEVISNLNRYQPLCKRYVFRC